MEQIISLIGALFCLSAYVCAQLSLIKTERTLYNLLNVIGSGILMVIAFFPFQLGFFVMEFVWFWVSVHALWKSVRVTASHNTPQ